MIKAISEWLYAKLRTVDYGEVTVTLKIHNGEIRHVEKIVKENEKPELEKAGARDEIQTR